MNRIKALTAAASMALVMSGAGASQASTIVSDFTLDGASGGLGVAAPYGQVAVDDAGGALAFTVTLFDGLKFRNAPDNNHHSFAFNLGGLAATVDGISDNGVGTFTFIGGPVKQSPFGDFELSLDCTLGCTTGYNVNSPSILNFTVTGANPLTVDNLTKNSKGDYFSADVVNAAGSTGNIAANTIKAAVPEPMTWAMMLVGFAGLGAALRQRRQQAPVLA